ncbi:hypothetical protein MSG28_000977 [Choristoneura fumiferana]|uniref:Uncharacterized protein n=1 Tax=Choristoneura fumiferana TaxID=7141 RepID=A0ACC0K2Z0_CHOFU|nr:hypothetical protein MSG28_000977 [Choristoneura fumiferana]
MNILITLTALAMANHLVMAETKEPPKDVHPKSGVKVPPKKAPVIATNHESTSTAGPVKDPPTKNVPKPNNLWIYNPSSQYAEQGANDVGPVIMRPHISRTRIAKAHLPGIDPYFNKGYFEPFEKRPKPVTLVTFRKNGLIPHQNIEERPRNLNLEVAEMQSPYNNIGSFWQDDIGKF